MKSYDLRHHVLTRAVYDPAMWSDVENERRLRLFEGITARSLSHQSCHDFEWIVQVHPADPLLRERERIVSNVGGWTLPTGGRPPSNELTALGEGRGTGQRLAREKQAIAAYGGWREAVEPGRGKVLTTRIDDDDAFFPDAVAMIQDASSILRRSTVLVFPRGIRVFDGRYDVVWHETNAWQTYVACGEATTVYDYPHRRARRQAPVQFISGKPAWLWVRHGDALSGHRAAAQPITPSIQAMFPVDWSLLPPPARSKARAGEKRFR